VQEVNNITEFNQLIDNIEGWEGFAIDVSGAINLGYLYKTSEIEIIESASIALESIVEPRPAGKIKIRHKVNGLEVTLFNIHLKCCGSTGSVEANRREAVSIALEAYINSNLPNEKIIVLGDWNDDLFDGPFDNFLNDDNFKFADESIASGTTDYWSYPYSSQYLSHLDHILITNELFDNLTITKTIVVDDCISNYEYNVSDHRAVMASFE